MTTRSYGRITVLLVLLCAAGCEPPGRPTLEFNIWHTETDTRAAAFIASLADSVARAAEADPDFPFIPNVHVTDIPWGGLVARMREERQSPPDVSHVEPFMMPQLVETDFWDGRFRPAPLDDLIDWIGPDNIRPDIRALHRFQTSAVGDSATFGLAYAIGTTFIAHRSDWRPSGLAEPRTWEDLVPYARALAARGGGDVAPFILPGRDPFFIAQLVNEMVVSLGGSLYADDGAPQFDSSPELERALLVLQEMVAYTGGQYASTGYLEQFDMFALGQGAVVPVTYGRATRAIENNIGEENVAGRARDFAVLEQPGPTAEATGVASIDAEPWVLIERVDGPDGERSARRELAMAFLRAFYDPGNYLAFARTVPVHLRPIRLDVEGQYDSLVRAGDNAQAPWVEWYDQSRDMAGRGNVAPILMDRLSARKRAPTYLLDLENQRILSDLVRLAASDEVVAEILAQGGDEDSSPTPTRLRQVGAAIAAAQERALQLWHSPL